MKLLLPEVNYGNGFSQDNDIFTRKKLSQQFESIIRNSDDPSLVLALDDDWGNGKTTFLKLWENEIITNGEFEVVYFDAFKNDYQEDAFLALASAIYPKIDSEQDKIDYLEAAKDAGKFLLKTGLKVAIGAATMGVLKGGDFEDAADDVKASLEVPLDKLIENKIKSAEIEVSVIEHFKDTITKSAKNKKIIFIIDELDRARPDFSLDLLEKIKHVFSAEKVVFLLSLNKEQFKKSIQKRYGDINAETYLSKFIHFWFTLPKVTDHEGKNKTNKTFIDHINKKLKPKNDFRDAVNLLSIILERTNSSLRDCERCFSTLLLVSASINGSTPDKMYQYGIAILTFLKIGRPEVYKKVELRTATYDDISKALNLNPSYKGYQPILEQLIISDTISDTEYNSIKGHDNNVSVDSWGEPVRAMKEMFQYFNAIIS